MQQSFPIRNLISALKRNYSRTTFQQLAKFLTATGRRLRVLGCIIGHFFGKGQLGLQVAIKIPFFVEIEISYEVYG